MTDTMLFGILKMPFEMAMSDEISRLQYYARVQELVDKLQKTQLEQEAFCFCHDGVSLQIVSGGAASEGYLGKVTLLIDGEYVDYVKAQPEQQAEPVAWPMEEQPDGAVIPVDPADMAPPQQQAEPVIPAHLDVRKILLAVTPGAGSGLEVYAKSVNDVVNTLTKMDERLERLEQQQAGPVAYDKTAMNCFVQRLYDSKMKEGKHGHYETMIHVVHQAIKRFAPPQQQAEPVADGDKVICPACCHQFRGIPETVQTLMLHAGFEPPFTTPPQQQAEPDRRPLQAEGKHPAPCARHCEAKAFEIEIRSLKSALKHWYSMSKQQAEPVGEVVGRNEYAGLGQVKHSKTIEWCGEPLPIGTKLYTTPPQQQAEPVQERITHITWDERGVRTVNGIPDDAPRCKELSEIQILDMMPSAIPAEYDGPLMEFARAVEAKLKERNK